MKREKYVIFGLVGKKTVVLKPSDLTELIGNQLKRWNPHPGGCHIGQLKETYGP